MRITRDVLARFTDLPADPAAVRVLLDEVGLEVKRIDADAPGVPMTLELLANRGDHHGYVGLAREITGRTGGDLRVPEGLTLTEGVSPHPIAVETDLCLVYTLTELVKDGDGTLGAAPLALLESCGLNPVSPPVDATNVANLELGQPTHAFDADTLEGPVRVRLSVAGERAWPLFTEGQVELPEGTLVIADDVKILAIAGVIGCEESKTTEATTRLLLESATFDPVSVRKASRALMIHTDSSARFERGADPSMPVIGAGRVASLLAPAGWTVKGTTGVHRAWTDPGRVVRFDPAACRGFLAIDEDDATLFGRLARYGFIPEGDGVRVPPHRLWDVEHPADLYEEIAKSIGYDNTPIGLPPVDMGGLPTPVETTIDTLAEVLVAAGFYEVITDGFHGRNLPEMLGFTGDHPLAAHVETANALDRAYSLLKNNALGQAVQGVADNLRMKHDQIAAFEVTRTFHPDPGADNGVCTERRLVWAIASGTERPAAWEGSVRPADAVFFKGLVDEIGAALRLPLQVGPADPAYPLSSALHPGRQAAIRLDGATIGVLGEVHPAVVSAFKIKRGRPVYVELGLDALVRPPAPYAFTEPPRVPPVPRSLAFTLPSGVEAREVVDVLTRAGVERLLDVAVVDLFAHEEDGAPVRTLTFDLSFDNEDAALTTEALNAAADALIEAVVASLGDRGVKLR